MRPSDLSATLIANFEVSSEAYYTKALTHPSWPEGASGVTIGIGYDLGYETSTQIAVDWADLVPPAMLAAMQHCAGVRAARAQLLLASVRPAIAIPYAAALRVFEDRTLPRYADGTLAAMPRCSDLSPDSFGALVSISYNRGYNGWAMLDDRHREMASIRKAIAGGCPEQVAALIRAMKRLWVDARGAPLPGMRGLLSRRDAEANLFEQGLAA
jgi:alkylhydroperoxidase/carboxymuconolactone decarboxylase family protein YurZ